MPSDQQRMDWEQRVGERFKRFSSLSSKDGAAATDPRDQRQVDEAGQTDYGTSKDAAIETIVTTADLSRLIPMPDDATLLQSTKASLLRCEERAAILQAFLQRELTIELQDAGVGFRPSLLDRMNHSAAVENRKLRADFQPRRQLAYQQQGEDMGARSGGGEGGPHVFNETQTERWAFPAGINRYGLYPTDATRSARVLGETRSAVQRRHALFDDVDQSMESLVTS